MKAEENIDDRLGFILGVPDRSDNIPLTDSLCTGYTTAWLLARLVLLTLRSADVRRRGTVTMHESRIYAAAASVIPAQ